MVLIGECIVARNTSKSHQFYYYSFITATLTTVDFFPMPTSIIRYDEHVRSIKRFMLFYGDGFI